MIVESLVYKDDLFTLRFEGGRVITLTWDEWMAVRRIQNIMIQTEPA